MSVHSFARRMRRGCGACVLCGITGRPPHTGIRKTALGAEATVSWEYAADAVAQVTRLRSEGCEIAAIETSDPVSGSVRLAAGVSGLCGFRKRSGWNLARAIGAG